MIVAIHQPNFFPWLGFFDKMAKADCFVLLDDVQFPRTGAGSWGNRVKCIISGEARWVTAPLNRSAGGSGMTYNRIEFQRNSDWRDRVLRTLNQSYRNAAFAAEGLELLTPLIENRDDLLVNYNLQAIRRITDALGLDSSKFVLASSYGVDATGTERLVQLTRAVGGSVYLCGGGASAYQEDDQFREAGLTLRYQEFRHAIYPQANNRGQFLPGLSVIDALMNVGALGTAKFLQGQ